MYHSRSHRSTREGIGAGGSTNPRAENVDTRGPDVEHAAVVGERRLAVARVNSSNCIGARNTGGAIADRIGVVVPSSNREVKTTSHGGIDGGVDGGAVSISEGHDGD